MDNETQYMFATDGGHLWHTLRHADGTWTGLGDVNGQFATPGAVRAVAGTTSVDGDETQWMFATDDAAACGCCRRFGQLESQAGKPHSGEADTVIKDLLAHWQVLSRTRRAV